MMSPTLNDLLNLLQSNGISLDTSLTDYWMELLTSRTSQPSVILQLRAPGERERCWVFNGTEWISYEAWSSSVSRTRSDP